MIIIDWQLSLATIILAPIISILVSDFGRRVMNAAENSQKQVSELAGLLSETTRCRQKYKQKREHLEHHKNRN